jgi:aminopeptidase N
VNEKLVNLTIAFDANYQVVSNGVLKEKNVNAELANWKYNMNKPMSSIC